MHNLRVNVKTDLFTNNDGAKSRSIYVHWRIYTRRTVVPEIPPRHINVLFWKTNMESQMSSHVDLYITGATLGAIISTHLEVDRELRIHVCEPEILHSPKTRVHIVQSVFTVIEWTYSEYTGYQEHMLHKCKRHSYQTLDVIEWTLPLVTMLILSSPRLSVMHQSFILDVLGRERYLDVSHTGELIWSQR